VQIRIQPLERQTQPSPTRACHCWPAGVRRGLRTVDVGIFSREFSFGALTLVVMTMTAPAALQ
jgi:hypothetical protein